MQHNTENEATDSSNLEIENLPATIEILHVPVMLQEVFEQVKHLKSGIIVDATFGAGGYSRYFLANLPDTVKVVAFDRDKSVIPVAEALNKQYPHRFSFHHALFSSMDKYNLNHVMAIVFDLGLSSMQIDDASRGFSFMPKKLSKTSEAESSSTNLKMTMGHNQRSAYDIINSYPSEELKAILRDYGEERQAGRIAKIIVNARAKAPISTVKQFVDLLTTATSFYDIKLLARVFQAIRIEANDELEDFKKALKVAYEIAAEDARVVVISFHSLEDRIIKNYIKENKQVRAIFKKVLLPSDKEIAANSRSRSAKMRAFCKIA